MRFLQNITHMLAQWTAPLITSSYSTQNLLDCALLLGSVSTFMLSITASSNLLKSFDYGKLLNPNTYPLNTKKHFPITWYLTKLLSTLPYFFPNTIPLQQHLLFHTDCLYFFCLVAAPFLGYDGFFPGKLPKHFYLPWQNQKRIKDFSWHLEISYISHLLSFWILFYISNCCFCLWLVQALWHR